MSSNSKVYSPVKGLFFCLVFLSYRCPSIYLLTLLSNPHLAPYIYSALFCLVFAKRLKLSVLLVYSILLSTLSVLLVYSILLSTLSVTSTWIALLQASSYRISMTYHCADVWLHTITRYRYTASDFLIKLIFIAMLCYRYAMLSLCYCYAIAIAIKLFTWCILNCLLGARMRRRCRGGRQGSGEIFYS